MTVNELIACLERFKRGDKAVGNYPIGSWGPNGEFLEIESLSLEARDYREMPLVHVVAVE